MLQPYNKLSIKKMELSPKENTLLRAYAHGLSEQEIIEIINFKELELKLITLRLFRKFEVKNQFVLISKAIDMGYIDYRGAINESTKTAILNFIEENPTQFSGVGLRSDEVRLRWYGVLLSFLHEIFKAGSKKIPPKRD